MGLRGMHAMALQVRGTCVGAFACTGDVRWRLCVYRGRALAPLRVPGTCVGALAWRARRDGHAIGLPPTPAWLDQLEELDPARVVLAHDHAIWEP